MRFHLARSAVFLKERVSSLLKVLEGSFEGFRLGVWENGTISLIGHNHSLESQIVTVLVTIFLLRSVQSLVTLAVQQPTILVVLLN